MLAVTNHTYQITYSLNNGTSYRIHKLYSINWSFIIPFLGDALDELLPRKDENLESIEEQTKEMDER